MSFERMVQFLEGKGVAVDNSLITRLHAFQSKYYCGNRTVLSNEVFEKFIGTWWEIELPDNDTLLPRCIYLADSLRDAFRLRPDIDTSFWLDKENTTSQFLSEIEDWIEEEDECLAD
jgi:hypothetical protein